MERVIVFFRNILIIILEVSMRLIRYIVLMFCIMGIAGQGSAEVRGAWVSAWSSGYFTAGEVDATIAAAKSAGLNTLFIQVRKNADAFYNSSIEPRSDVISADFDPLAYTIEKAHREGIKVHAWVNIYRVWTAQTMPQNPNHIVNAHPDWLNKANDGSIKASEGIYLDPGVPEAREHIASVVEDIARRYKVDGIQLDYIRYPGEKWGYSEKALARYYAETGAKSKPDTKDCQWMQWRRDQVTALVRMIRDRVKTARPSVILSAATIPWGDCPLDYCDSSPYKRVCQDWRLWLSEGLLDANAPMNYKSESNPKNARQFREWLSGFKKWSSGKPIYVGVDIHNNSASDIQSQIKSIREYELAGFILFSFNDGTKRDAIVSALSGKKNPTLTPAQTAFDKGVRFAAGNQLGMAKVYLGKAIELDMKYAEAYFRLGRCYLREQNTLQAKELFTKTLEIDPSHEGAKRELDAIATH